MSPQEILTNVMERIVVDKSADHAKPQFDLFFTSISTPEENYFFPERQPKKTLRDSLTRAALSGLLSTTTN